MSGTVAPIIYYFYLKLLLFLNAGRGDVEKSSKIIHNYYKIKKSSPQFFANRDVTSDEIQNCLDNQDYVSLPITPSNCHLIFHRLSNYDPKSYTFDSAAKTFIMLSGNSCNAKVLCCMKFIFISRLPFPESSSYHNGPRSGIVFLFDLSGVGFMHLFKPSIGSMMKGINFLEEGMPFDIEAVHVLNSRKIFDMIVGKSTRFFIYLQNGS